MLGVIFILFATAMIYVFIATTFVSAGKVVYKAATKSQTMNSDEKPEKILATSVIDGVPVHQGCFDMNPAHIKDLQNEGKRLTKKQQDILELEQQARNESPVEFDRYEYVPSTNSCVPMIDSVEKLREFNVKKAEKAGINIVEKPAM